MTTRESLINTFLASTRWQNAQRQVLDQDASFRRYWRLTRNGKSAILMDAPPPEKPVSLFAEIAWFLRRNAGPLRRLGNRVWLLTRTGRAGR